MDKDPSTSHFDPISALMIIIAVIGVLVAGTALGYQMFISR